ncbi:hypothetical protein BFJ72_g12079 [Fusarium proliferatum]|uniref:Uncharacterized protein n=1 Tax=Gibberella intermedia TaxID=948311 RepID=A0A420SIU4_GIBIN|nr:hypothetical protein BFJ72_g12079 [Fusarium proliferatum]
MAQNIGEHVAERIVLDPNRPNFEDRNLRDVADGTVLVGQFREVFESGIKTELITDIELQSAEWVLQFSIENEAKGTRTMEESTELGMTVTSGQDVSESVKASAGFSGWGFSVEVSGSIESKTFNKTETSSVQKITDTYVVPPESSIFVYKRRYKFRCRSWFHDSVYGSKIETQSGIPIEGQFFNEITANQELISPVALTGQGLISNDPPSGLVYPDNQWSHDVHSPPEWAAWYMAMAKKYPWTASI